MSPTPPQGEVELRALGSPRLIYGGDDLTAEIGDRRLALLVYVFHEDRPLQPSEVIRLLGGDAEAEGALEGLAEDVRWLRRRIPGLRIAMTRETVQGLGGVWLDTRAVDEAIDGGDAETVRRLYSDGFLAEFSPPGEAYRDWAEKERSRLERAWNGAIRRSALSEESHARWANAARWWSILAARAPLEEDARARLLRARAMGGDVGLSSEAPASDEPGPASEARHRRRSPSPANAEAEREAIGGTEEDVRRLGPKIPPGVAVEPRDPAIRRRLRPRSTPEVFTDSVVLHAVRTTKARLTTPGAIEGYRQTGRRMIEGLELGVEWVTAGIVMLAEAVQAGLLALIDLSGRTWGGLKVFARWVKATREPLARSATRIGVGTARAARRLEKGGARIADRVQTAVSEGVESGLETTTSAVTVVGRGVDTLGRRGARTVGRGLRAAGRASRAVGRGTQRVGKGLQDSGEWVLGSLTRMRRRAPTRALPRTPLRRLNEATARLGRPLVEHRVAVRSLLLAGAFLLVWPGLKDGFQRVVPEWQNPDLDLRGLVPAAISRPRETLDDLSLPEVTLPHVSLPDISVPDVPQPLREIIADLRRSGTDLVRAARGPLVDRGGKVVIVDLSDPAGAGMTRALALGLEAYLRESRYLSVQVRERTLLAGYVEPGVGLGLSWNALREGLGPDGVDAVVGIGVRSDEAETMLRVQILDPTGGIREELEFAGEPDQLVGTLESVARRVRRVLGEPEREIETTRSTAPLFAADLRALEAYVLARERLYQGRFGPAVAWARESLRHDPGLALAHYELARAHALNSERAAARAALEDAWSDRRRLGERERLRLQADRLAYAGRYEEAVSAYEELFQRFRDDVGALKSQFIVRTLVEGTAPVGNLQVAYRRDPVDWPPLHQVGRYLGFRRRLPDVDSLRVALGPDR